MRASSLIIWSLLIALHLNYALEYQQVQGHIFQVPINYSVPSNKYPNRESRNISKVCNTFKGDICNETRTDNKTNYHLKEFCLWKIWALTKLFNAYYKQYFCTTAKNGTSKLCPTIRCQCIDSDGNMCQDQIYWSSTSSSISIDFSYSTFTKKQELLIIMSEQNNSLRHNKCLVSQICKASCSLISQYYQESFSGVDNSINIYDNKSAVVTFKDLPQDTNQILYVIKVIDNDTIGSVVTELKMRTKLAVPKVPSKINITEISVTNLKLEWDLSEKSRLNGPAEGYQVNVNSILEDKRNTSTNNIVFDNLEECTQYCFVVASFNKAGTSADSPPICARTSTNFTKVELLPMSLNFSVTRTVRWRCKNDKNCSERFEVQYSVRNHNNSKSFITSERHMHLDGLAEDKIYHVKVRPFSDNKFGEYSSQDFHTFRIAPILRNLSINHINDNLHILWTIYAHHSIETFSFSVFLMNSENKCLHLIKFECKLCERSLSDVQPRKSVNKVNCNTSAVEYFTKHNTMFEGHVKIEMQNVTIIIYSNSSLGLIQIARRDLLGFTAPKPDKSSPANTFNTIVIIICILIISAIIVLVYLGYFKGHLSWFKRTSSFTNLENYPVQRKCPQTNRHFELYLNSGEFEKIKNEIKIEHKYFDLIDNSIVTSYNLTKNSPTNIFGNVIPNDQPTVILQLRSPEDNCMHSSFIPFVNDLTKPEYIVCQNPTDNTISDFWQIIWEQNISLIVMLARTFEGLAVEGSSNWQGQTNMEIEVGQNSEFVITLEEESGTEIYKQMKLKCLNTKTNEKRNITHICMFSWNEYFNPSHADFETFLYRFHELTSHTHLPPYLIQCSAGLGKTGTFIVIDRITRKLANHEEYIDVYQEVLELRKHQKCMVQNKAQYYFIHEFLKYFLRKYSKVEDCENDDMEIY